MSEYHSTVYALTLLSEYTHTLDSLPIDLSRNFADLRELDAVLSSSIHSITAKIYRLISMIEDDTATNADRLWLLSDIAAEAQRLKVGGEDKIRVACQGADNLKAHAGHLRALTEHIPGFDASVLDRKTTYPHVSDRAYMPTFIMETGRRRRGGLGSIMVATNPEPSPVKRKRVAKEDDVDVTGRSPKKPVQAESSARVRSNGRKKCAYFRFAFESVYLIIYQLTGTSAGLLRQSPWSQWQPLYLTKLRTPHLVVLASTPTTEPAVPVAAQRPTNVGQREPVLFEARLLPMKLTPLLMMSTRMYIPTAAQDGEEVQRLLLIHSITLTTYPRLPHIPRCLLRIRTATAEVVDPISGTDMMHMGCRMPLCKTGMASRTHSSWEDLACP